MVDVIGYSAAGPKDELKPQRFTCDEPRAREVQIGILYCGVCHSDIHQVKNEWGNTVYPCMPGHEVVGRVVAVGDGVTLHKVGDIVGVGCMIDSCRDCEACRAGEENYCIGPNSWLATYNGPMVPAAKAPEGRNTYERDNTFGGYATSIVVKEDFVLKIPAGLSPQQAAPILCAGVTTYSPMKHWGVKAGDRVGIVGYGGLGNMAGKIAKALGAQVTVFTTHPDKQGPAEAAGVDQVVDEGDEKTLEGMAGSFDFILSTVPNKHDINPYIPLLKRDRTLVAVGALEPMEPVNHMPVAFKRRSVAGSLIGSIAETQEVLEFCANHGIAPDIQVIPIEQINEAYERVEKGDVRFRYVIDIGSLAAG
jgi:uncharacterized zinc-type alcohol dehydrogenase-like protein